MVPMRLVHGVLALGGARGHEHRPVLGLRRRILPSRCGRVDEVRDLASGLRCKAQVVRV